MLTPAQHLFHDVARHEGHVGRPLSEAPHEVGIPLSAEWHGLFDRYSDRFLLGSDTWINERWFGYDTIFKEYRGWLAQLPAEQARRIANGNALRLFSARTPN